MYNTTTGFTPYHRPKHFQMAYTHNAHLSSLYPLLFHAITNLSRGSMTVEQMAPPIQLRGRRFNCAHLKALHHLHLSNEHRIADPPPLESTQMAHESKYLIVTAADKKFYPSVRVTISTIQRQFSNSSIPYRILFYDLDGELSSSAEWRRELGSVCFLELRVFRFSQVLPKELHNRRSFAWKLLIIAESFKELAPEGDELLIYGDSSAYFESSGFDRIFNMMAPGNSNSLHSD